MNRKKQISVKGDAGPDYEIRSIIQVSEVAHMILRELEEFSAVEFRTNFLLVNLICNISN